MEPRPSSPRESRAGVFSPFRLGRHVLRNRFVMPAMQRGRQIEEPDAALVEYYRQRAAGGISLVVSECCIVDHPTAMGGEVGLAVRDGNAEAWRRCADAVHGEGSILVIQLIHEGGVRREGAGRHPDVRSISPSGRYRGDMPNGVPASDADLAEVRDAFVAAAVAAQRAGADGVEVHGAHGYLLDQFLWRETNDRADGYGGADIRDRVRYPAEIVRAVRKATGPDFLILFRFSQWKEVDYDARVCDSPEELGVLLGALRDAGVDVFHVSTRYYWKTEWDTDRTIAAWCKALTDAPVITVGSVGLDQDTMTTFFHDRQAIPTARETIDDLQERFARDEFDLVAVGRGLIGDPDWVRKAEAGAFDAIRTFARSDLDMSDWDMEYALDESAAASPPGGGPTD